MCILNNGEVTEDHPIDELKKKYCVGHVVNIKMKPREKKEVTGSKKNNSGNEIDQTVRTFIITIYARFL